jgi:hypothetical protein
MPPPVVSSRGWSGFAGTPRRRELVPRTNGWKVRASLQPPRRSDTRHLRYDGRSATNYSAGSTTSAPFFFSKTTMNFAGFVVLALRPTVCTSVGPS